MGKAIKGFLMPIAIIICLIMVVGCNNTVDEALEEQAGDAIVAEAEPGSRIITDMAGRTVEVPEEVKSVLGLSSTNRFILYLDAADMMAGVREMEQRTPHGMPWAMALRDIIQDVPLFDESDLESISAINPDLILLCSGDYVDNYQDQENMQARTNIPVVITKPYVSLSKNTKEFYETVEIIGRLLGKEARAEELINGVKEIIEDLNERTKDIPEDEKPKVYVGGKSWAGSHGLTSTSSFYSAFDLINANNAAADLELENAFIDPEALIAWDPDIIFLESAGGFDMCIEELGTPAFKSLKAVQNNEVHRIFLKIWNNANFSNVLINAYYVGSVLYPDRFNDIEIAEKADEIYELFLGRPLYDEMVEVYGEHGVIDLQ